MPSSSEKQAKFMNAIAHSKKFAAKVGVSQSVGKEFHTADKAEGKFAKTLLKMKEATDRYLAKADPNDPKIKALYEAAKLRNQRRIEHKRKSRMNRPQTESSRGLDSPDPKRKDKLSWPDPDDLEKVNFKARAKDRQGEDYEAKTQTKYTDKAKMAIKDMKSGVASGNIRNPDRKEGAPAERSTRGSGTPMKPEGVLYAAGDKRAAGMKSHKGHTIYSYGAHWPVVQHHPEHKTLVVNTHDYGGQTKLMIDTLLHELPKQAPGHRIVRVNHPDYQETSRIMRGGLKDVHQHLQDVASSHPDEARRSQAARDAEHVGNILSLKKSTEHSAHEEAQVLGDELQQNPHKFIPKGYKRGSTDIAHTYSPEHSIFLESKRADAFTAIHDHPVLGTSGSDFANGGEPSKTPHEALQALGLRMQQRHGLGVKQGEFAKSDLEKRSKNVRNQTRNIDDETAARRVASYAEKQGLESNYDFQRGPHFGTPNKLFWHAKFAPTKEKLAQRPHLAIDQPQHRLMHEVAHAINTPSGTKLVDRQKALDNMQSPADAIEEGVTANLEPKIARRAGVKPIDSRLYRDPKWLGQGEKNAKVPDKKHVRERADKVMDQVDNGKRKINPLNGRMTVEQKPQAIRKAMLVTKEALEKSKNAKIQRRAFMSGTRGFDEGATHGEGIRRLNSYMKQVGLHAEPGEPWDEPKLMGRKGPNVVTSTDGEGPHRQQLTHEASHAFQTPVGRSIGEYQAKLGAPGDRESAKVNKLPPQQEPQAQFAEAAISRRSGLPPFRDPVKTNPGTQMDRAKQRAAENQKMIDAGIHHFEPGTGKKVESNSVHANINRRAMGLHGEAWENLKAKYKAHREKKSKTLEKDAMPAPKSVPESAGAPKVSTASSAPVKPIMQSTGSGGYSQTTPGLLGTSIGATTSSAGSAGDAG
jgi:hypothetical protein